MICYPYSRYKVVSSAKTNGEMEEIGIDTDHIRKKGRNDMEVMLKIIICQYKRRHLCDKLVRMKNQPLLLKEEKERQESAPKLAYSELGEGN